MTIIHNRLDNRFETLVNGGVAHVEYEIQGKIFRLILAKVPCEAPSREVATALVLKAFEYAAGQLLHVASGDLKVLITRSKTGDD